jgi:drug/metabolite transporter (DMT)-like permease
MSASAPGLPSTGARAAPVALALAIVAVSFSSIFIRFATSGYAVVVWVRLALTIPFLLPLLVRDVRTGMVPRGRREWTEVGFSGACLSAHFLVWTASLQYTSVASSVLLVSTHPVLVAVLSRRLLGEAVTRRLWLGIALAMTGTLVTAAGDLRISGTALYGDLLALLGAVTVTGYILVGRSASGRWGAAAYSVPCYALAAAVALVVAPFGGEVLPTRRTLLACLGLAVVCTVFGHTVINWTLHHLRATTISVSLLGEPPITALLAIPLLAERPPSTTVLGGAVVLTGLALAIAERAPERLRAELALPTAEA